MTNTRKLTLLGAVCAAIALAGCASSSGRAPVVDIGTPPTKSKSSKPAVVAEVVTRPVGSAVQETYLVQKGDTLYSIAFNYGLDYHELAEFNGIQDPAAIQIGQQLRIPAAAAAPRPAPAPTPATKPVAPVKALIVDEPKAVKLPYSEQAVAKIEKMQQEEANEAKAKAEVKPAAVVAKVEAKPAPAPILKEEPVSNGDVAWGMPADGKVVAGFSENDGRKGIDIAGKLGQPVFASAGGKVVYSGSGLRGYGKLVIVKHNETYLSAYAHNSRILVKEGQTVARGQKIAEMGDTDSDRVELHFEIRKQGKPVDPSQYLRLPKS